MKSRIFHIMQYVKHPITGEPLMDLNQVLKGLNHKSIKKWAYVYHDKDVYTERDEKEQAEKYGKSVKAGDPKPAHFHIVIQMGSNQIESFVIAKWFGIADNFVDCAKGAGAFLDCVEYLTHENEKQQKLGKHLYADDEIHCSEGFDFRTELNQKNERRLKYGKDLNPVEEVKYKVQFEGLSLLEVSRTEGLIYMDNWQDLEKRRREYLMNRAPMPKTRINYYICGNGGVGKGLTSRALARALFPNLQDDREIFHVVGAGKVAFEGYDGQPVIIWDDCRAFDLLERLGGRGNVFDVFDSHPNSAGGKQNIKYGSVRLVNCVNIVNSVQPYMEFLDGLAGEYEKGNGEKMKAEDKNQSYRRFPFIIPLHEDDFDLLVNKGFMYGNGLFQEYESYNHIRGNLQKVRKALQGSEERIRLVEDKMMSIPKQKYEEALVVKPRSTSDLDVIMKEFEGYGTIGDSSDVATDEIEGFVKDKTDKGKLPFTEE